VRGERLSPSGSWLGFSEALTLILSKTCSESVMRQSSALPLGITKCDARQCQLGEVCVRRAPVIKTYDYWSFGNFFSCQLVCS